MKTTCDKCGYNANKERASERRSLAQCDDCGMTYCEECLKEMAVDRGLASESDANLIIDQAGANGLLWRCEASGDEVCPECFEGEPVESTR